MNNPSDLTNHGRSGSFWQLWSEAESGPEDGTVSGDRFNARMAWKRFFSEYLGVAPEDHWLFSGRRFRPWFSDRWVSPNRFNPFVAEVMSKGGGLLSLYVLHLLAEKPRYGNDIMCAIEERTEGRWGSNPGAVYPLLTALEDGGLVEGVWEDERKRTRRVYSLTSAGRQELDRLSEVIRPMLKDAIHVLRDLYQDLEAD